jgi:hypothetical protein
MGRRASAPSGGAVKPIRFTGVFERPSARRPLAVGARLASSVVTPHPEPPMPLQLNDEEMSVLMSLAGPIDQQRRPQFLQEVAAELEAKRQAREVGEGLVHRVGRVVQRKYWDPPVISPNATAPVHRGHAA